MNKEIKYFKIKTENFDAMKNAKKIVYVAIAKDGFSIYRSMSFDTSEEVTDYLSALGCKPIAVSLLSRL